MSAGKGQDDAEHGHPSSSSVVMREPVEVQPASISSLSQGKVEILQYKLAMLKQLKSSTILGRGKALESVNNAMNRRDVRTNILNATAVSTWLVEEALNPNRKYKLVQDLKSFYAWRGIPWKPPRIKRQYTSPFLVRVLSNVREILLPVKCREMD